MKNSEILIQARQLIKDELEDYVCLALMEVSSRSLRYDSDTKKADKLRNWVQDVLLRKPTESQWLYGNTYGTLEDWMRHTHPETYNTIRESRQWRQLRLNWMDWMIQHYQSKGQ